MSHVCFYVTGHGFGHAARVQAVVEELLAHTGWTVEVRSGAPAALFAWLLGPRCRASAVPLEPGVVQLDSIHQDLPATLRAWREHLARVPSLVEAEAAHLEQSGAALVVSDTSPAGIAAAAAAGVPAFLLGNFTWDWILEEYLDGEPGFAEVIATVRRLQRDATAYLRLPMSVPSGRFAREEEIPLVARQPRRLRAAVRAELGASDEDKLVLLSFGGFGVKDLCLDALAGHPRLRGLTDRAPSPSPHLISAAGRDLHYPDLIRAADLILTKPGYGIFSEAIAARTPVAFVPRAGFREAPVLERWLEQRWPCLRVAPERLADGSWVDAAADFVERAPPCPALRSDGAGRVVELISERT